MQIQFEAQRLGLETRCPWSVRGSTSWWTGPTRWTTDLNLIKGGGGALLKEKVLLSNSKRSIIVADERKFAERLCENGVRVPVEASPFARSPLTRRLMRNSEASRSSG